ncbi:hypothetical protein D3C81_1232160 [compost metagenome]
MRRDVRCHKAPKITALHRFGQIHLTQHTARRVAFPTVAQRIRQITAALPLRRITLRTDRQRILTAEQQIPANQRHTLVKRERHGVFRNGNIHRRTGHQIGIDIIGILTRHPFIRGIRHGRIQMTTARCHALGHRQEEVVLGPAANPLIGRRRQVTAIDSAERRIQRIPPCHWRATAGGMTGSAVGGLSQIAATGNLFGAGGYLLYRAVVMAIFTPPQHGDDDNHHQQDQQCETFFHCAVSFTRPGVFSTTSRTAS